MDEITKSRQASTLAICLRGFKQKAFDSIRKLPVVQTRPERFLHVLGGGDGRNEQESSPPAQLRPVDDLAAVASGTWGGRTDRHG